MLEDHSMPHQDWDSLAVHTVREGLAIKVVDAALEAGKLTAAELDRLAFPRKTFAHRRTLGRLSPEQSDRFLRIMRVIGLAEACFGEPARAGRWLRRRTDALAGDAPLELLDTDIGVRQVELLLGRIGHGIAA